MKGAQKFTHFEICFPTSISARRNPQVGANCAHSVFGQFLGGLPENYVLLHIIGSYETAIHVVGFAVCFGRIKVTGFSYK